MIESLALMPGGNQPAVPRSVGPSGECGPLVVVMSTFDRRWWHFMQRFVSVLAVVIGKRS
jgi:hypothetical protein